LEGERNRERTKKKTGEWGNPIKEKKNRLPKGPRFSAMETVMGGELPDEVSKGRKGGGGNAVLKTL